LTCIPVLGERVHGKFSFEVIFGLAFEFFKLFLSCIPLAIKFLQGGKSIA
jgi:hypothetical protein